MKVNRPTAHSIFPNEYNIIWKSPSRDSLDSMPLSGRHGAGANIWVQDGSIWIYLGHSAAFDEKSRLLKLGCVRITPANRKIVPEDFEQMLDLATGAISIKSKDFTAELYFIDQALLIETHSSTSGKLEVSLATWRDKERTGLKLDMGGSHTMQPDHVIANESSFIFYHRNADYTSYRDINAVKQGFQITDVTDRLSQRLSGVALVVEGGLSSLKNEEVHWQYWEGRAWTGQSVENTRHRIAIRIGAGLNCDPNSWHEQAKTFLDQDILSSAKAEEQKRWDEFWSRSYIIVNPKAGENDPGFLIGRNYQLFRYMMACNREGEFPLLFNGGIFTTDNEPGRITGNNNDELKISYPGPTTPDYRRWMYCEFMSQNQRWLGWPTLANGDVDILMPSTRFYRERAEVAKARAKLIGAIGVVYPEPMDALGLCCVNPRPDGLCGAEHLTFHFSMMLEHAWMTLQAHDMLGIPIDQDVEWITDTILFYDSYYRKECQKETGKELSSGGKLIIYPANGLEYAVGARNPIEVVAGMKRITQALLALDNLPANLRSELVRIEPTIPELPIGMRDGKRSLLPAESFKKGYNRWEPIEHYAAWPYRLVGVTQPGTVQLLRDTWDTIPKDRAELCKQDYSWMANVVNMAAMGLTEQAKERAIYKLANNSAPQARFPAFFGPGHDWLPDHNWGGSGCTGLQEMLVASQVGADSRIYLLPAWPMDWDVKFKLHAANETTIEGTVQSGKIVHLNIQPANRLKDIVTDAKK